MKRKTLIVGCILATAISLAGCSENVPAESVTTEATQGVGVTLSETPIEEKGSQTSAVSVTKDEEEILKEEVSGNTVKAETSVITYEIKTETRTDDSGKEIIKYEYPVFSCDDSSYKKVIDSMNKTYLEYMKFDLDSGASDFVAASKAEVALTQKVFDVSVSEQDALIFISVGRTQEVNGPHPNNYNESFVINKETKEFAGLTDVVSMDDERIDEIAKQIAAAHSGKDADVLKADIKKAIDADKAGWRIEDDNLIIWFEYDDITGAYHGDGEYAAIVKL
ncbi:MAG: hypothetical protein K6G72_12040 [Lachnospiraceae bacterium]|nr:hypothetical protein [Lachnospiraceae bacterium]